MKTQSFELLAPSGNLEHVRTAIAAGADSIYIGIKGMSARPDPWSFSVSGAAEVAHILHKAGRRIYMALNAEYPEYRAGEFLDNISQLEDIGGDAFVVGDWGLIRLMLKMGIRTPIHASTLLGVYNLATVRYLRDLGVSRIIFNTDLFLDEIATISFGCPEMEYEIIAYGGICFSDNHRCRLPHYMHKESYHVGCELRYQITQTPEDVEGSHEISIHKPDIDLSSTLRVYTDLGITSFKIEGRTRPLLYIYESVSRLRHAIDFLRLNDENGQISHYLINSTQTRRAT